MKSTNFYHYLVDNLARIAAEGDLSPEDSNLIMDACRELWPNGENHDLDFQSEDLSRQVKVQKYDFGAARQLVNLDAKKAEINRLIENEIAMGEEICTLQAQLKQLEERAEAVTLHRDWLYEELSYARTLIQANCPDQVKPEGRLDLALAADTPAVTTIAGLFA